MEHTTTDKSEGGIIGSGTPSAAETAVQQMGTKVFSEMREELGGEWMIDKGATLI